VGLSSAAIISIYSYLESNHLFFDGRKAVYWHLGYDLGYAMIYDIVYDMANNGDMYVI
jgi:hypothetical protein